MNNYWAFLSMRSSADLLDDQNALRERLDEDGYLYLPQVLDPDRIQRLRDELLRILDGAGWLIGGKFLAQALSVQFPVREGDDDFAAVYDQIQRLESFHALAHDERLSAIMQRVLGPSAFPHPLKIARLAFPMNHEVSTPPHQDFPNNQGTPSLTAAWIPVGDCPRKMGGLAVLRGSNKYGVLPLGHHPGAGNRQALVPEQMLEELRWVTTDFEMGDLLLFPSTTVHASLNNETDSMRLSVDFRFQLEGERLTPPVLEPHFQRLTWDDVYEGWTSTELQYYWRDLSYELVPFEHYEVTTGPPPEMPDAEVWAHLLRQEARHNRRLERLADSGFREDAP
jgi:ectoine hydroxylase-related dioxygenase (phytanoyl-CoA dioxygenase family)